MSKAAAARLIESLLAMQVCETSSLKYSRPYDSIIVLTYSIETVALCEQCRNNYSNNLILVT